MTLPPDDCVDCLRGVRREDTLFGESVDISVFLPDRGQPIRDDWLGASVNWDLADGGALNEILNRRKDDEIHFKGGAVRLPRIGIDSIVKRYGAENFGYELMGDDGNKYHGHLLFSNLLRKERRTTIYGALCYIISYHHKQENQNA